jgi:hypothetical protein
MITATYSTSYESTVVNTGEPAMDVKESESRERKNLEYSEAIMGSQIGHSTLSRGKLCTWGSCDPFSRNGRSARDERLRPQVLITWGW